MQLAALNQLVTEGLASGEVKPLPVTVFNRSETEEAFRYLASGRLDHYLQAKSTFTVLAHRLNLQMQVISTMGTCKVLRKHT